MFLVWLKFLVCAAIVVISGTKLSKYGDAIAEKTSLTGAWVGLLLLATITSMPEMVTGVSSVAVVHIPDLAVGTVFGSNLFNLLIIALLDIQYRSAPLLSMASKLHIISAGLCMLIIAIAGLGIFLSNEVDYLNIGWYSVFSLLLLASYFVSLRLISRYEQAEIFDSVVTEAESNRYADISLRRTCLSFVVAALLIVGAGIWMAMIGDEIADVTGWEASFVGSMFLAIISSLPELTVCTAALRIGAIDMAIADIFGSNMFNTGIIIAVSDLFYWESDLMSSSSVSLAIAAGVTVAMTGVIIGGLLCRSRRKVFRLMSWEVPALVALYVLGVYILFTC